MLSIAVLDDSEEYLSEVEKMLSEINRLKIDFDVFSKADDLLVTISREGNYDVYLLDIELSGGPDHQNGLKIAETIRKTNLYSIIIFLTAHDEYMLSSFEYIPFYYLNKSAARQKLENVLVRAEAYLQKEHYLFRYMFHKTSYSLVSGEILYFYKKGRKAYIYTQSGIKECNLTMKAILSRLEDHLFVQINKSYIINLRYVEEHQYTYVRVSGQKLHLTDSCRQDFIRKYSDYADSSL